MKRTLSLLLVLLMLCCAASAETLLPWAGDEVVYTGLACDLGMANDENSEIMKLYREHTGNVKIEWTTLSWNDWSERVNLLMNSGDLPDIVWVYPVVDFVMKYGDSGMFLNFRDYAEYMPNLMKINEEVPAFNSLWGANDEIYAVTDIDPYDMGHETTYVNLTKLAELGVEEVPETWAEWIALMEQFKASNPDGTALLRAGGTETDLTKIIANCMNGFDEFAFNPETQAWEYMLLNEDASNYRKAVEIMAELYSKELIDPEFDIMDNADQIIQSGNWLFSWMTGSTPGDAYNHDFDAIPYEYAPVLPPVLNSGDTPYNYINYRSDVPADFGFLVNANVENPELICSYIDFIISEEASVLFNWGIEGTTYAIGEDGLPDYIGEYTDSAKLSEIGVYNFNDVRFVQLKQRIAEVKRMHPIEFAGYQKLCSFYTSGALMPYIPVRMTPIFDEAQKQVVSENLTPIETYVEENVLNFIVGARDLSEWDAFVEETLTMGDINKVIETYAEGRQVESAAARNWLVF